MQIFFYILEIILQPKIKYITLHIRCFLFSGTISVFKTKHRTSVFKHNKHASKCVRTLMQVNAQVHMSNTKIALEISLVILDSKLQQVRENSLDTKVKISMKIIFSFYQEKFSFSKLVNHETNYFIIHIKIVNPDGGDK